MPVILFFFLIFNLVGCASQYHDKLQEELDLHNMEVLNQLEMGAITQVMAEQQIEEELKEKRKSLEEYHAEVKNGMDVFWTGLFTTLKIGMALATSYIGGIPGVYQLGEAALTSLQTQMTADEKVELPPKTFKLPPDFDHLYGTIKPDRPKCRPGSSLCRVSHWEMLPEK